MAYHGNLGSAYNRSTYDQPIEIVDFAYGHLLDLSGKTFVFEVADPDTGSVLLSATLENGKLTNPSTGVLNVKFTRAEMMTLAPGEYNAGMTWSDDNVTVQLFAGTLPVNDGITV